MSCDQKVKPLPVATLTSTITFDGNDPHHWYKIFCT